MRHVYFYASVNFTESVSRQPCNVYPTQCYTVNLTETCFNFVVSRYASLYFCCCIESTDNELLTLEVIHRYVELLDKYFGSVSLVNLCIDFQILMHISTQTNVSTFV